MTFSVQEPEYLYDTGFATDPFVQEAEKKPKAGPANTPSEDLPTRPAATLAAASSYAAPAASAAGMPAAAAPTVNGAALSRPIDATPAPAEPSTERWWMIRAAVVMVLLVVGRKMQLSARARLVSPRRRPPKRNFLN